MTKNVEIIDEVVEAYFNESDKTLKEIFGEYTKDFSEDQAKAFYERLKEIVS